MALPPGLRLGPYEILSPLGSGGMGEVYRARDSRLGRDVAIKILPAELSADPDRLQRFEQEARLFGTLNHPNLLAIYDVGNEQGWKYLVTALPIDGPFTGVDTARLLEELRYCKRAKRCGDHRTPHPPATAPFLCRQTLPDRLSA